MSNKATSALFIYMLLGSAAQFAHAEDLVPNPSFIEMGAPGYRPAKTGFAEPPKLDLTPTATVPSASAPAAKPSVFPLNAPDLPPIVVDLSIDAPLAAIPARPELPEQPVAAPSVKSAETANILHDRPAMMGAPLNMEMARPSDAPDKAPVVALSPEAEQMKAALTAWLGAPAARSNDRKRREAVAAFYETRAYHPLWVADKHWTAQAKSALGRIAKAEEDGLSLSNINLAPANAENWATQDVQLSELTSAYIAQAYGGRIEPGSLSKLITARTTAPDYGKLLAEIVTAKDADAALQAANPPQKGYAELRAKLAELRNAKEPMAKAVIPAGPILKIGMKDERVPLIRAHFGIEADAATPSDAIVYDTRVAAAVKDFQTSSGLPGSGTLTPRTIALLSGGQPSKLEGELIANMEVWRWLPRELGRDHIEVNIPEYTARLYRSSALAYSTRVVVGKTDTQTPVFSSRMTFLIVNPYWNVPLSIINKEMLPKLAADPDYFTRHGYELVQKGGQIYVRQPPGDANALGRIKFMFPNEHSVYLHDTPSKSLFAQSQRAFSHGCVRVDQPFRFAEAVLGGNWSEQKVRAMVGGDERTVYLPESLPIHLMYMTARVDEAGKLQLREDVYGHMRRVKALLGVEG